MVILIFKSKTIIMSETEMQKIIDDLNSGELKKIVHSQELTKNVIFANVWDEKPHDESKLVDGYEYRSFYLIKKSTGEFIGLIYLMKDDLHWYLNKENRGKGYMTRVLGETVIPHLLNFRNRIKISIDFESCEFAKKSENLAIRCGFRKDKDGSYYFSKWFSNAFKLKITPSEELSNDRYYALDREVNVLLNRLKFMKSEMDMKKLDPGLTLKLNKAVKSIIELRSFL